MQCFVFFKEVRDFFGDEGLSVNTSGTTPLELKRSVHPRRKQNYKNRTVEVMGDKRDEFLKVGSNSNVDVLLELFLGGEPRLITRRKRLKTSQRAEKTIDIQNKELGLWQRRDAMWKRK